MFLNKVIATIVLFLMVLSCSVLISCTASVPQPYGYIAFSLREAQRLAQFDRKASQELVSLGGMTRIVGMVHDQKGGDIILVGRVVPDQPEACLDDLVVALRARILYDEWPMVSIDPTARTSETGQQQVNFGGGIAGTYFGKDFLDCDIILKKYSLELLPPIEAVPSYKSLCLDSIKKRIVAKGARVTQLQWLSPDSTKSLHGQSIRAEESYQTRFWFFPLQPFRFVAMEGVFCIKELRLGVSAELEHANRNGTTAQVDDSISLDRPGELFSSQFTEHFREMESAQPLLKRLKILYDMVAVAEGIKSLKDRPDFTYFLKEYSVLPVQTPKEYELIQMCALIERSDGLQHAVQISGGIKFKTELKWLNYGSVTPLRDIVLKTRPSADALLWTLPLEGWRMPNSEDLDLKKDTQISGRKSGCSVFTQSFVLEPRGESPSDVGRKFYGFPPPPPPPPPPAAFATPDIEYAQSLGGVDIAPEPKGERKDLGKIKKQILESRPSKDSLFWNTENSE